MEKRNEVFTKKEIEKILEIIKNKKIKNKDECYLLYNNYLFGNRAFAWNSYPEILKSEWKGNICIRGRKTQINRGRVVYNVGIKEVPKIIKEWGKQGIPEEHIGFNQSMPDEHLTIQGEVMKTHLGFVLWYTTIKEPMNSALKKESLYAEGLKAYLLLKNYLSESSYEDLIALMELFPESSIEFSSYRVPVGNLPGRNTVIWEVRDY